MAGTILVTPKGLPVMADGSTRDIFFPAHEQLIPVDTKLARAKGGDRIAAPDFENRIAALMRGEKVDLTGDGQLRFGAGYVVKDAKTKWPFFGKFDSEHPTRGDHLTPAAGLVEDLSIPETAWKELCEEFIPRGPAETAEADDPSCTAGCSVYRFYTSPVGYWKMTGMPVLQDRPREYAKTRNYPNTAYFNPNAGIEVVPTISDLHWTVYFGSIKVFCLIEFEPDTSSVECLLTGEINLPDGWTIVDGERLPNGNWRSQPVLLGYPYTSKANIAVAAAKAGFTRVDQT